MMRKTISRSKQSAKKRLGSVHKITLLAGFVSVILGGGAIVRSAASAPSADLPRTSLRLLDLQVFAKRSINGQSSDYEGPTAARGGVALSDFTVDGDLSAGQLVSFDRGAVKGRINAPDLRMANVLSSGKGFLEQDTLELASVTLDLWAERLSKLPQTSTFRTGRGEDGLVEFKAEARRDLEIVDLDGDSLPNPEINRARLILTGDTHSQLLIRVHGRSVSMKQADFSVTGGLDPSRIVFFFPEATDLAIVSSGGAHDGAGRLWNVPGSIVAPSATFHFAASTVTGQVFVQSIVPVGKLPSGQVNRLSRLSEYEGRPSNTPFTPSQLLQLTDSNSLPFDSRPLADLALRKQGLSSTCQIVCPD